MRLGRAPGRRSRRTGSGSRSTRPATRRSGCLARRPLRAAPPPLRHDARPRDRRHGRAPDGTRRELRRQGREERGGLRPRQALLRLARPARARRATRAAPAPAADDGANGRRRDARRWAELHRVAARAERVDLAGGRLARALRGRRSARSTRRPRSSAARRADPWEELRALQAGRCRGRRRWDGGRGGARAAGPRESPTCRSLASRRGARSRERGRWRRCAARADRRLRPLRVLPADLPHLRALARGDGLAARAHPSDVGTGRRLGRP